MDTNKRFGYWTVIGKGEYRGTSSYLLCQCQCGTKKLVAYTSLLVGRSKSCGCGLMNANLSGKRFGRLTVVDEAPRRHDGRYWNCACQCGHTTVVKHSHLKNGNTKSCGCLKADTTTRRNTTHSMTYSREYTAWQRMKARCNNPSNADYARYGGRGIRVCDRWLNNFEAFCTDMGPQPPKASIDRINNDGNYEPGNCRWATQKQQCRNKGNNRRLTYNGETLCMTEWAERVGVKFGTIQTRIDRYGWTAERALTTPVK